MLKYVAVAAMVVLWLSLPAGGRTQEVTVTASASTQEPTITPFQLNRMVDRLPEGPLYWRLQTFATRAEAEAAAGPTGQVGEAEGSVWLFTLGAKGGAPAGGTLIDEIGPLEAPSADTYLLRNAYTSTPPRGVAGGGDVVHTHPGAEAFFVFAGEQTVWTPGQAVITGAGRSNAGVPADTPLLVVSTGSEPRRAFTLFVVDAARPFASPALFPAP